MVFVVTLRRDRSRHLKQTNRSEKLSELDGVHVLDGALLGVNDVLLDGRKVSGVITSTVTKGECIEHAVLGIGINIATTPNLPSGKFVQPPGSLRELAPDILITLPAILPVLLESLARRHARANHLCTMVSGALYTSLRTQGLSQALQGGQGSG